MGRTAENVLKKLRESLRSQFFILSCIAIKLWQDKGYDEEKIEDILRKVDDIWDESTERGVVMLQMLEDETGIELRIDGDKSYHEYNHLNYNGNGGRRMTSEMQIAIMNHRKKWLTAMFLASLILAMSRLENTSDDEMIEFAQQMDSEWKKNIDVKVYKKWIKGQGLAELLVGRRAMMGV